MAGTNDGTSGSGPSGIAEPGGDFSSALAAAVLRRIEVPKITAATGNVGSVRIGEILLENASVDRVDINDIRTTFSTGDVFLSNARAIVQIQLSVRWWYDFWFASDSGTVSLGSVSFPFNIGDISIPSLQNISLEVPSASLNDVIAAVHPVANLDLGAATYQGLQLDEAVLPSAGFGLSGLSLGAVRLNDVTVPAASTARLSVDRFRPNGPLVLPSLRVDGVELPAASAPLIRSEGLIRVPQARASRRAVPLNLGVIGFEFRMDPILDMFIEAMVIRDLAASASIARIDLRDVSASVTLNDLTLGRVDAGQLRVDRVTV